MASVAPTPPRETTSAPEDAGDRDKGKAPAGAHLERRQKRNTDLTEQSQRNPGGGAHSGTPDPTNP